MTNKDFVCTLDSKELAQWIVSEPWRLYVNKRYINDKITYQEAVEEWLNKEK